MKEMWQLPVYVSVYRAGCGSEKYSARDAHWDNRSDYGDAQQKTVGNNNRSDYGHEQQKKVDNNNHSDYGDAQQKTFGNDNRSDYGDAQQKTVTLLLRSQVRFTLFCRV